MQSEFIDFYSLKNIKVPKDNHSDSAMAKYARDISEYSFLPESDSYPEFTTFKYREKEGGFTKRTIDYMFISKEAAARTKVRRWLSPPREDQLDHKIANPCVNHPSDHYSIAYEVEIVP